MMIEGGTAAKSRKERHVLNIGFLGGDRRMQIAAEQLKREGYTVRLLEGSEGEAVFSALALLVLPYPATRDGETVAGTALPFASLPIPPSLPLFGGRLPATWCAHRVFGDAEENEQYLRENAYLTAAAGVATALRAGERAFFRVTAGVIGYGRIGKETARMLRALGAAVTVYVRRAAAKEEAERDGFRAVLLSEGLPLPEDLLFGTAPAPAENLASLCVRPDALVYDLGGGLPAALPDVEGKSVTVLPLRGAPGVFAPRAAGEIYGGAILDFIRHLERRTTS